MVTTYTNPYAIGRRPTYAANGMVATSQPLAAQAGLRMLERGGNAMDAALATAAALTVVEPTSNSVGGDVFAIVWKDGAIHGLNGSGRAPAACDAAAVQARGYESMPLRGWLPVTVPGEPRAWADLHARFASLPLPDIFAPAVTYARKGYPLSPVIAEYWRRGAAELMARTEPEFAAWREMFTPSDFKPAAGTLWHCEALAQTLEAIAATHADAFYSGHLADRISAFAEATGGLIRKEDLRAHRSTWVDPISINYRGIDVWELPPNTQGIATLQALSILDGIALPAWRDNVQALHLQIEAMKHALTDALQHVSDPDTMALDAADLLNTRHIATQRARIGAKASVPTSPVTLPQSDTVYLCTADASGMMVSFIQSSYEDFGSGIVVPGTGIGLQNRGNSFALTPGHANALKPGKRPYHTLMPGFLSRDGEAIGPFGVMGGFMQPQGQLQVAVNMIDYQLNPQTALDAPRWQWLADNTLCVEQAMPAHLVRGLQALGHNVRISTDDTDFGRGQIISRLSNGVYAGGSDSRADAHVAAL